MDYLISNYCKRFLILILLILPVIRAGLLPDDLPTDDAEILEREKRDGFFERLFKTFPLFKHDEEKEEKTEEPDEIELGIPEFEIPNFEQNFEVKLVDDSTSVAPILSTTHSSALFISPSLKLQTSTGSPSSIMTVTAVLTPSLTISSSRINSTSSTMTSTTVSITQSLESTTMPRTSVSGNSIMSSVFNTIRPSVTLHTSVPQATVVSSSANLSIQPTPSSKIFPSATLRNGNGPVYDLELVLAAPRLPDEKGYANILAQEQTKGDNSSQIKSTKFFISNLFVPIMSGLFGALCISLVIMMIKCIRKRKLRKIRYYGGKPESRLYGLDHMGLLSDMSSDEE